MTSATEFAPGLVIQGFAAPLSLSQFKLIAFDMDSTLISIECIDEIADAVGRKAEVAAITEAALRGEITDFQDSLRRRLALLQGVTLADMGGILGEGFPMVRAMPNTAIAIRESMTCLCASGATPGQTDYIEQLFGHLGRVARIDERLMDAATVLGACGIAYALRYVRASIQGGIEIGFDAATAALIAAQTVKGAAELLIRTGRHPEEEIDKVTTPRGCTIAGLNEMEHRGFSSSLIKGITASYEKIGH